MMVVADLFWSAGDSWSEQGYRDMRVGGADVRAPFVCHAPSERCDDRCDDRCHTSCMRPAYTLHSGRWSAGSRIRQNPAFMAGDSNRGLAAAIYSVKAALKEPRFVDGACEQI